LGFRIDPEPPDETFITDGSVLNFKRPLKTLRRSQAQATGNSVAVAIHRGGGGSLGFTCTHVPLRRTTSSVFVLSATCAARFAARRMATQEAAKSGSFASSMFFSFMVFLPNHG
jgi:hypothetical protein